ncbi:MULTISPECIES: ATP-binding cassette domain-containing protein [Weissella]|uniref:ATP-binding cassette domain-containing protein n=1 Tax=Weissella TaxID=46255 RepID=UPI0002AA6B5B|nr:MULTISPECIES: ATP-binding cassette domain-containing protein [Weissella]ELA07029.1 ABC transporter ATP-binding protein [Weissella ceti NC36]QVV91884.1 ATP-binding cassette domain-containing protein [Weissella tructae]
MTFSSINNVTLQHVSKKFGTHEVTQDLDLIFKKGEITTIFGPSGAGKSTLLNMIGLVDTPDTGEIKIFGETTPKLHSREARQWRREKIDYLFQNFGLIDDMTVQANLAINQAYKKGTKADKKVQQVRALTDVGLGKAYLTKKVYDLSGGEQQRVAIVKTILKDPEIILADEPTGSLDEQNKKNIVELLINLKNQNKTLIIVSHDKYFEQISDQNIYLK